LVPYKRVDLAIQACNELQLPLVVVGKGSEEEKLRSMAGPTVRFVGSLTDEALAEYYKNCLALLFPGEEDFGLTIIEAASFGKPVIAYKKGGALETVIEGKTGMFFATQTSAALKTVLALFNPERFSSKDSIQLAEKFSEERFQKEMLALITNVV
jgi:glycosyltransferase involved in cell wall biosynthesis